MKFEEYFQTLLHQIDRIERDWETADTNRQLMLATELREHREISDRIVDQWIQYEEKLSNLIKKIKSSAQALKENSHIPPAPVTEMQKKDDLLESYQHLFRKGEGFYHLRLFEDAKKHFATLLAEYPDWEHGRLYYGYSLLFSDEKEAALKEFRLLSRSACSPKVAAISYNAIGSILAQERHYMEAEQSFQAALETVSDHPESLYNLALCYLQQGDAQEAMDTIEKYLAQYENDWEAHIIWLRADKLLAKQERKERIPPISLQLPTRDTDPQLLREMAMIHEANGKIHLAQLCYRYLVEEYPLQGWAWHGLAWNTWLITGEERAFALIKKAVSLAPKNVDFLFSYGWMHLCAGRLEKATEIFRFVLSRNRKHFLSQSGLITVYARQGEYVNAKKLAQTFLDEPDPYVQSLGYYHLGRLAVLEENWQLAKHYFKKVMYETDQFAEVPQYLKLCNHKLGANTSTQEEILHPANSM